MIWAPVVLAVAIAVGTSVRPEVVALVAGVWNVAHTLRQRYGLCKLYGRLSGVDCGADNRLLWSWLTLAVIVAFARTDLVPPRTLGHRAPKHHGGRRGRVGRHRDCCPTSIRGHFALVTTARWARRELRRSTHSSPRLFYLASTAALLVVLAVDPVVGFVGYVGAHAAEYLLVVRWRVDRAAQRPLAGDHVGALARRVGSGGTLALYAVAVAALIVVIRVVDQSARAGRHRPHARRAPPLLRRHHLAVSPSDRRHQRSPTVTADLDGQPRAELAVTVQGRP